MPFQPDIYFQAFVIIPHMKLPTIEEAHALLDQHVADEYQRHHARMVATAMLGYAKKFGEDEQGQLLWYVTGLLHDVDFDKHPETHPAQSLGWFKEWGYPDELIHAVEAHAYGYNGFTTLPQTKLAAALMACDEMSGIFYAYKKMNPVPYAQMKASSVKKKFATPTFASRIERPVIVRGCEALGVTVDEHIANLVSFFAELE